jgi:hypothetical protein
MFGAIIDLWPIKHIWLVGNNSAPVQGTPHPEEPRSGVSKDGHGLSWFETREAALLTMRV